MSNPPDRPFDDDNDNNDDLEPSSGETPHGDSVDPFGGDDPFEHLPDEMKQMLEQLGGPEALEQARQQIAAMFESGQMPDLGAMGGMAGFGPGAGAAGPGAAGFGAGGAAASMPFGFSGQPVEGPVDWTLATRVALQIAEDGDRSPTDDETVRAQNAFQLAEHWLDATPLPAPPDAGQIVVGTRQMWVNAAVAALKPLVEPVARAATDAMIQLTREQFDELREHGGIEALGSEGMPEGFEAMLEQAMSQDPAAMMRPAGAALAGLQAGQVIGKLARQLLGQYDLGLPTAPRGEAHHIAVNVTEDFEGYGIDLTEVSVMLALNEAAHRRLYHAVPWLETHMHSLVARFASGTEVDADRMRRVVEEMMTGVDPDDPEALGEAVERAATLRMEPTEQQKRILARLQAVVCLTGAWARHEIVRAIEGRLPAAERIEEVLRRRRATRGDGEELLAGLLGLDLKPADETVGEQFVATVEDVLGPAGLHRALAHPENLPDADELADPHAWIARTAEDSDVPDDASALFGELADAPREASFDERLAQQETDDQGKPTEAGSGGGDSGPGKPDQSDSDDNGSDEGPAADGDAE